MWEILIDIIRETIAVFNDVAFYLLLGLFLAGIIKQFIPTSFLIRHLGKKNLGSVIKAALIGVPLPLCSCSVLPTAIALKKEGATNGATTSFLISTPETGIDSISLTYALLDPLFTVFRPLAAFITAFVSGAAVNMLENSSDKKSIKKTAKKRKVSKPSTKQKTTETTESLFSYNGIVDVFRYGFSRLLGEIAGWLLIGIFFAGVIAAIIPEDFFSTYLSDPLISMIAMVIIGIPVYMCATGSTPVAAAMLAKGLNPGAALVFLLVGPATNIGSYFVLRKYIEKKYLVIYYISLIVVSLMLGLTLNLFYGPGESPVTGFGEAERSVIPGWIKIASSLVLLGLLVRAFHKNRTLSSFTERTRTFFRKLGLKPKTVFRVSLTLIIILYVLSGFHALTIGDSSIAIRFGKVIDVNSKPGLYFYLPYPFTKVITQSREYLYTIEIGYRSEITAEDLLMRDAEEMLQLNDSESSSDIPETGIDVPAEGLVFTGDENIINIDCVCLYRVKDPYKYMYNWKTNKAQIRLYIQSAIRRVINRNDLMKILVMGRFEITHEIERETAILLDKLDLGIEIVSISLTNIHAPPRVHYYFRDVASSMEDKQRAVNRAEKYALDTTIRSRGEAAKIENDADAYSDKKVLLAKGEVSSFIAKYRAYLIAPSVTRFRLYIESIEKVLQSGETIFMLKFKNPESTDFWFNTTKSAIQLPQNINKEN